MTDRRDQGRNASYAATTVAVALYYSDRRVDRSCFVSMEIKTGQATSSPQAGQLPAESIAQITYENSFVSMVLYGYAEDAAFLWNVQIWNTQRSITLPLD